jgi:hypothetical protein
MIKPSLRHLCLIAVFPAIFAVTLLRAQGPSSCLKYAYPKGQTTGNEERFDHEFDTLNANGASFSCGPAIAASKARDALEAFRYGVLYHDKTQLDTALEYPLTVRINKTLAIEKPELVIVHNATEWFALQKDRMTDIQIEVIACSWLGNVTVKAGNESPGFFIGGGLVWFQRHRDTARVRVTAVNLMPLTPEMLARSCAP